MRHPASCSWQNITLVAFDLETTGPYPLQSEICEIAAVKWRGGDVVGEYQTLIRPNDPMSDEVIAIHRITNEMIQGAPSVGEVIKDFYEFIGDSVIMAHHAPFDLGFLAIEFEKALLAWPSTPILCSSLLSRKLIPEAPNHKLQTLVQFLNIDGGEAHRALDDAKACLQVGLEIFRRCGENSSLDELMAAQGENLLWENYSIHEFKENPLISPILQAISNRRQIFITYNGGTRPGQSRLVLPIGIVRNPQGDFLVTKDKSPWPKRYLLKKITETTKIKGTTM